MPARLPKVSKIVLMHSVALHHFSQIGTMARRGFVVSICHVELFHHLLNKRFRLSFALDAFNVEFNVLASSLAVALA